LIPRTVDLLRNPWARGIGVLGMLVLALAALWWRGPEWDRVYHAFDFVAWWWIVAALALNLVSVLFRAVSWRLTIGQALPDPQPAFRTVFSAFSVGLLGNAVLPARAGELARVAVLRRHLPHGRGTSATLLGTVFAHRLFDLFPVLLLVAYVLATAKIPHWAVTSLYAVGIVGLGLFTLAVLSARRHHRTVLDGASTVRRLLVMARQGLAVMKAPLPAAAAVMLQILGWAMQLLAVWVAMRAFDIDAPLPAAGLVLLLMNVATIFPLWPGNIGLLQAAVALPLVQYGVAYTTGFAYGLVLQVVEMSVGVGIGLLFLAREGLTFASLQRMEEEEEDREEELVEETEEQEAGRRARAGVSG
jgi:glycosyltransferase 2 family protein